MERVVQIEPNGGGAGGEGEERTTTNLVCDSGESCLSSQDE